MANTTRHSGRRVGCVVYLTKWLDDSWLACLLALSRSSYPGAAPPNQPTPCLPTSLPSSSAEGKAGGSARRDAPIHRLAATSVAVSAGMTRVGINGSTNADAVADCDAVYRCAHILVRVGLLLLLLLLLAGTTDRYH